MNVKSALTFTAILAGISKAQVTLPLYLNSKATNHLKAKKKIFGPDNKNEFQNSVVYASMDFLKRSDRGKRLMKVMKRARMTHMRNVKNRTNQKRWSLRMSLRKQDRKLNHHYPLFQGYGSHYVTAWVGTPPQRVTLLVDTGSYTTAFPCKGCTTCGEDHTDAMFDPDKSSTFHEVSCDQCSSVGGYCSDNKCTNSCSYLEESSWEGYEANDQFFLGDSKYQKDAESIKDDFTFVCQTSEKGLFQEQLENGIMGLKDSNEHLPNVLHSKNKIPVNQFSLCMTEEDYTNTDGYLAGFMTMGGVDTAYHKSPMMYASAFNYQVNIKALYLQPALSFTDGSKQERGLSDRKIRISADYASGFSHAVDSGTTITYFDTNLGPDFKKQWKALTGMDLPSNDEEEITISDEQMANLPTVVVQLEGVQDGCDEHQAVKKNARKLGGAHCIDVLLSFPPKHYLYKTGNGTYNININFEQLGIGGGILGANIIQGHDVLFDETNNRIGFAPSKCRINSA